MTSLEHGRFCDEVVNQTGLLVGTVTDRSAPATTSRSRPVWSTTSSQNRL